MDEHLSDNNTYEALKQKVKGCLQNQEKEKTINRSTSSRRKHDTLCSTIQPKIHKDGNECMTEASTPPPTTEPNTLPPFWSRWCGDNPDFTDLKLEVDETMASFNFGLLFTSIPTSKAAKRSEGD